MVDQVSKIVTKWGHLLVSEFAHCTFPIYANRQTGRLKTIDNEVDSRIKPEGHIWLSPTALQRQETERRWAGISRTDWYPVSALNCDDEFRRDYTYPLISGTFGTPDEPDWMTPLRLKIKGEAVNLGSHLAEYRETTKMFSDFANGFVTALKISRGKLRGRRHLRACDIPATTLLSNWGIAPLVDDVEKSVLKLQHRIVEPIYSRFAIKDVETRNAVSWFDQKGWWKKTARPVVYCELDVERQPIITGNVAEILWEGVPSSVIVDYMLPIGDWLSTLDALKAVESLIGTVSYKEQFLAVKNTESTTFPNNVKLPRLKLNAHYRDVITDIPTPPFPSWDPSASYKRLLNATSLLALKSKRCKDKPRFTHFTMKGGKRVPVVV